MSHLRKWTQALCIAACLVPWSARAEWRAMDAAAISDILTSSDIAYGDFAWERHEANGTLLFRTLEGPFGRTSVGEWQLREGARCLRWNGAMDWECYTVETDGTDGIRFIDAYRNVSEGRIVPRGEVLGRADPEVAE